MTLNPSDYNFWWKEYPMFTQWALQKDILFIPKEYSEEEQGNSLTSKVYLLMKRLRQDYHTLMSMDSEELDEFFNIELEMIKKEQKDMENSKNNTL
jgi:hypothetical protein